ncbi:predicted protein [Naegleria gruberi]|uniref:Predicted protein n=1 Tax=Naegleria gruberi TaxID=5762 RepID=D2UXR7_NAEGR|nr:uncharacterized protein NAEGRDRAFT_61217 [Naegleria gruberi]EFC50337.1 predicted protein [Naegleria gruberi]|eukprot:XP_002683081.1 predicted protein [Naegleria gruberi strain NEG-M]
MEDVESALDDLEYFDPILSPLEEEKMCMDNICQCLNDCFFMIKQYTEGEESFNVILVDQSLECFQLAKVEPSSNYSQHQIVKIFINLKIYALKCLAKLISVCSLETTEDSYKELSKNCAELFVKDEGLNALFECLVIDDKYDTSDQSDEKMRLIIVETLFFFVCRNEIARLAVVFQQGLLLIMELMTVEPNSTIRSYYCAILREFCITYPEDLVKENCIENSVSYLAADPCDDVRALSAEIVEMLIKTDSTNLERIDLIEIAKLLNSVLNNDTSAVVESCCKLCETLFKEDTHKIIHSEFIKNSYWVSLVRVMKNHDFKTASCAIRAIRYLAQFSERDDLAQKCLLKFDAISTLLKFLLDTTFDKRTNIEEKRSKFKKERTQKHQPVAVDEACEVLKTTIKLESAFLFSMLFYRSPRLKQKVKDDLKVFPNWIMALRRKLVQAVAQSEISYFENVEITNELGWNMANFVIEKETVYDEKTRNLDIKNLMDELSNS